MLFLAQVQPLSYFKRYGIVRGHRCIPSA